MKDDRAKKTISPSEYLHFAVACSENAAPASFDFYEGFDLVVDGDVHLFNYANRNLVRVLPEAKILGNLLGHHCPTLERVDCSVEGAVNLDATGVRSFGAKFSAGGVLDARGCKSLRTIKGNFPTVVSLEDSGIEFLGKDFACGADLFVGRCPNLRMLDCRVSWSLHAEGSGLAEFGPNFRCGGDIRLGYCKSFKKLGMVRGRPRDVLLPHSGVVEVESGFACTGALVLTDVDFLERLSGQPHGRVTVEAAPRLHTVSRMRCGGELDFSFCPSLRHVDFAAGGAVKFHQCGMTEFSGKTRAGDLTVRECDNLLTVGGRWPAGVNLIELRGLKEILPSFRCGENLLVRGCDDLSQLSGRVGGAAAISRVGALRKIGPAFSTGENLVMACGESRLGELGCCVGGDLIMTNCKSRFSTSSTFRVAGDALFQDCPGMEDLRGHVEGTVRIKNKTGVRRIGADFECGQHLVIAGCPNLELLNCRIAGNVLVEDSSLKKTGPAFCCSGRLTVQQVVGLRELKGRVGGDFVFFSETQKLEDIKIGLLGWVAGAAENSVQHSKDSRGGRALARHDAASKLRSREAGRSGILGRDCSWNSHKTHAR